MSKVIDGAVNSSTKSLTRFSKETSRIGDKAFALGRQAGAFGLAVGIPLFKAAEAAEESEKATRKLEQVFKSMGETSGKSAKKAQEFASSLMMEIAVDDENIIAVQTKLATFEKVIKNTAGTSEIFERATRAAFDLEAAGFGEGTQNAVQLGKALQDPIKGINALARSGVTFTDSEKDKIRSLVESGQHLKAQKILLEAVEKQVGGVAKANVSSTAKIKIAFGEVVEKIGGALLPMLERFSKWLDNSLPKIIKWLDENQELVSVLATLAAIVSTVSIAISGLSFVFGGAMKALSGASTAINGLSKAFSFLQSAVVANPIVAAVIAIIAIITLLVVYWKEFNAFFSKQSAVVKLLISILLGPALAAASVIRAIIKMVQGDWRGAINQILETLFKFSIIGVFFPNLFKRVQAIFWKVVAWMREWGVLLLGPIGFVMKYWSQITTFFVNIWTRVKSIFLAFLAWHAQLPAKFYKAGEAIVNSIWNGMKAKFGEMKNWFKSGLQDLRDMLPFSPAKRGPLKDIHKLKFVETIAANIKPGPMVGAMDKALSAVRGAASPKGGGASSLTPAMAGAGGKGGGGVTVNFSPTINVTGAAGGGANAKQDFLAQLKQYQPELMRVINDALARKERAKY
jgi:hypothetical protein